MCIIWRLRASYIHHTQVHTYTRERCGACVYTRHSSGVRTYVLEKLKEEETHTHTHTRIHEYVDAALFDEPSILRFAFLLTERRPERVRVRERKSMVSSSPATHHETTTTAYALRAK